MTILITGASGQLGRLAVDAVLARGADPGDVIAATRDVEKIGDLAARGVTTRRADFDDPDSLAATFAGVDRLLLVSTDALGERHRLHGNAVRAAADAGVGLLAYTSIPHAETARTILAAEHRDTEEMIAEAGLPHVFLRNSWYHENYTAQLPTLLEHGLVGAGGDGRFSPAARADYAEAAAAVLTGGDHAGRAYELGGATLTLADVAATITSETGRDVRYRDVPEEELRAMLVGAGLPPALAEAVADADTGLARGELLVETGDLERLLGRPATTFAEAVRSAL